MDAMTPTELRECLEAIGWSQRHLADLLAIGEARVRRMASGRVAVPDELATWLRVLRAVHDANPIPIGWRARAAAE